MNRMLVLVFDDEGKAYEGSKALVDLHKESSLTVYAYAIITKDATGAVTVKRAADQGPVGTTVGMVTGALVGLLGGPVGLAVGAASGTLTGSIYDLMQMGIDQDFVTELSGYLLPGKSAVVADVDEEWVTPVNTRIAPLGGLVFRRLRGEFISDQIERGLAADQAELARLKAERDQAIGEAKTKLQAMVDATQKRIQTRQEAIKQKIESVKREGEAKINALQAQSEKAKGDAKVRLEKLVADMRKAHEIRVQKLSQAWQLIKEAAAA